MNRLQLLLNLPNSAILAERFLFWIYRFLTRAQGRWVKPLSSWEHRLGPATHQRRPLAALLLFFMHMTVNGKLITSTNEQQAPARCTAAFQGRPWGDLPRPTSPAAPPRRSARRRARGAAPFLRPCRLPGAASLTTATGPGTGDSERLWRVLGSHSAWSRTRGAQTRPLIGRRWGFEGEGGKGRWARAGRSPPHGATTAPGQEGPRLVVPGTGALSEGERPGSGRGWVMS